MPHGLCGRRHVGRDKDGRALGQPGDVRMATRPAVAIVSWIAWLACIRFPPGSRCGRTS